MKQHYRVYVDHCNLNGGILDQFDQIITSESLKDAIREAADWECNLYTMLENCMIVSRDDYDDGSRIEFRTPEGCKQFLSITAERWN